MQHASADHEATAPLYFGDGAVARSMPRHCAKQTLRAGMPAAQGSLVRKVTELLPIGPALAVPHTRARSLTGAAHPPAVINAPPSLTRRSEEVLSLRPKLGKVFLKQLGCAVLQPPVLILK